MDSWNAVDRFNEFPSQFRLFSLRLLLFDSCGSALTNAAIIQRDNLKGSRPRAGFVRAFHAAVFQSNQFTAALRPFRVERRQRFSDLTELLAPHGVFGHTSCVGSVVGYGQ